MRIAGAALNQTALDWGRNLENIRLAIAAAASSGVDILLTPELCISGYGCEDAYYHPSTTDRALDSLSKIIALSGDIALSVGLPIKFEGRLYNCSAFIWNKKLIGLVAKARLAGDGVYYEPRWFTPWELGKVSKIALWGEEYPIGDLFFDLNGIKVGFEICEDGWVADRRGSGLAKIGCDLILNPSASHFALHKFERRKQLAQAAADSFGCAYLLCNTLGVCSGRLIFDGDTIFATPGNSPVLGRRLSFEKVCMTTATVDVDKLRAHRSLMAKDETPIPPPIGVSILSYAPTKSKGEVPVAFSSDWDHPSKTLLYEELSRSIPLGLYDYLRKSGLKGFVLSLSGGADSGSIAVFVYLMVLFGVRELGVKGFTSGLGLNFEERAGEEEKETVRRIVNSLLLCVYQPTENNSELSREIAIKIATTVGAELKTLDVQRFEDAYVDAVSELEGRKITWELDDLALQNIQARVRSPGIWLLANLRGRLLLASSNRSEGSVGYSTMDGDTSGSFNPIGGIDKATLLRWLNWMAKTGPAGVGPMPELQAVAERAPSAELRPLAEGQTDEKDLMPYEILNHIERRFVRDRLSPAEIKIQLRKSPELGSYDLARVDEWVDSFFRRWRANQWKRERFAPCFQLDEWNVDPKTWCRWPIVSGKLE